MATKWRAVDGSPVLDLPDDAAHGNSPRSVSGSEIGRVDEVLTQHREVAGELRESLGEDREVQRQEGPELGVARDRNRQHGGGEPLLVEVVQEVEELEAQLAAWAGTGNFQAENMNAGEARKAANPTQTGATGASSTRTPASAPSFERQEEAVDQGERAQRTAGEDEGAEAGAAVVLAVAELMQQDVAQPLAGEDQDDERREARRETCRGPPPPAERR